MSRNGLKWRRKMWNYLIMKFQARRTPYNGKLIIETPGMHTTRKRQKKELKDAKRRQAQAIAEQRKAQREQQAIQTAEQTSSLITATANLWASYSKAGLISLPVALGSIATMWGSFLYSKIKAAQLTKTQYGEGGYDISRRG
jgi:predicted metal-dependent hydrolase